MNFRRLFLTLFPALFLSSVAALHSADAPARSRSEAKTAERNPNIVIILADDLGYGDVGCYNSESKVPTPNLDRLAGEGMRFTDAHSASTVCTPSRYSLMTGRMCFRTGYRGGVFSGAGGPSLIEEERVTLPGMLRDQGYATGCVGKWHIGMTFQTKEGTPLHELKVDGNDKEQARVKFIDFTRPITDGPVHRGFDYFFGTACCPGTDWLYAFIENDRVPVPPDHMLDVSALPKHPYANDCRRGFTAPGYDHEMIDMVFLDKSKAWLEQQVKREPTKPFFLYHAMQAVHLPSFAAPQFKGKTKAGPHGDFIAEMDFIVGELMATLQRLGVADNTLIIFSSDNGPETTSVVHMRADYAHDPARPWRGVKRDDWEGGHRVPFIVRWPGRVKPGATSAQLTSLTDVMATIAAIIGANLPDNAAEDSFNMLPASLVEDKAPIRPYLLQQAFGGARTLSIRRCPWKYLDHTGSGGNRYETDPGLKPFILPDTAPDAPGQLHNLETDPGETKNLYAERPEIVKELKALLDQSKVSGRSRLISH